MKIYLKEITENELELEFTEKEPWVTASVQRVDEHIEDSMDEIQERPIDIQFSLRKVDEVVVLAGKISTTIQLVCSRCATLFQQKCTPTFSALFCKDPVMAGVAHLQVTGNDPKKNGRIVGQNQGFARHAHDSDSDESTLQGKDLDITYLSNDFIDLSDVLTEQLQFQTPFQPLCNTDCKGICSNCGVDLNHDHCLCQAKHSSSPFSALRDLQT